MTGEPVPVLWLIGPSGVGKSTVGYELFGQLDRAGVRTGYLDLDQVGLCYPGHPDDPDNHRLKAAGLAAVWPNFRAAGVECLVLSGGVETPESARAYADGLDVATLTLCRLRVGRGELVRRFVGRGWEIQLADEAVRDADAMDRTDFADACVDTDEVPVPEVARLVRERTGGWPYLT